MTPIACRTSSSLLITDRGLHYDRKMFRRKTEVAFLVGTIVLASCGTAAVEEEQRVSDSLMVAEPSIGAGLQFGFCHAGYSQSEEEYDLLDDLGAEWIRIDLSWKRIESVPGVWDFSYYDPIIEAAVDHDIKVLAVLGFDTPWTREALGDDKRRIHPEHYPAFLEYTRQVARRYGAQVGAFEVWNEPNLPRFWGGTDEEFFRLTREVLAVLDEESPGTPVGAGSIHISPVFHGKRFLRNFLDAGCMVNADALTLHPYSRNIGKAARWLANAGEEMRVRGIDAEIWVTEVGFPTESMFPYRVSLEDQPGAVAESLRSLTSAGANLITWYKLFSDKEWEKEAGPFDGASFGLVWKDDDGAFEMKPGAEAFRDTVMKLRGIE